MRIFLWLLS